MAFMVLSMTQLFHSLNLHSLSRSLFHSHLMANRWLLLTFVFGIALQILVCTLPLAQQLLHTVSLDLISWLVVVGLSASVIAINEFARLFR